MAGMIQMTPEELHGHVHCAAQTRLHREPLVCAAQRVLSDSSRSRSRQFGLLVVAVNGKRVAQCNYNDYEWQTLEA